MQRLVERMLPAEFLLKLGIYLQSCAHLELALWQIVQLSDGHDLGEAPDMSRYFKLKKVTKPLIASVRKSIAKLPPVLAVRVAAIIERVDAGRENRNMAAHGAFYLTPGGNLQVEHYLQKDDSGEPVWHYIDHVFNMRQIDQAVEDVDCLLREANAVRAALTVLVRSQRPASGFGRS